jgi:hypothetical protein
VPNPENRHILFVVRGNAWSQRVANIFEEGRMVWGSIHCAVSLPRELENLVVPPRETALLAQVQEGRQCAGPGTFIRRISILLCIEGVPCEPGHRAENREWERARFFEKSITECHLLSFLGKLSNKYESPTRHCTYGGRFRRSPKTRVTTEAQRGL